MLLGQHLQRERRQADVLGNPLRLDRRLAGVLQRLRPQPTRRDTAVLQGRRQADELAVLLLAEVLLGQHLLWQHLQG